MQSSTPAAAVAPTSSVRTVPTGASPLETYDGTGGNGAGKTATLSGLSTSASAHNYLPIFMCLPNAVGDNYEDSSVTLQYQFAGTQRSGQAK